MHSAPLPDNEAQRLAELRFLHILDTPFEERFDRITRTAAKLFQVPISLVSLLDDSRQWFKSCQGLDIRETSRKISFCSHAILADGPFVIEDARKDSRFADNPLVTGKPHIVFYAGHPLVGPGGHKLGTLCLIDHQPRLLSEDEDTALRDLAAWVELELGAIRMEALISCLADAMLIFDSQGIIEEANPAAEAVFSRSRQELLGQQIEICIPDYTQAVREQLGMNMMTRAHAHCGEYSGQRRDRSRFPLEISVSMTLWEGRQIFICMVHDLTARKEAEKTLHETLIQLKRQFLKAEQARSEISAILDASKEAMLLLAPDGSVLEVNHRFEQFFSVIGTEIKDKPFSHFLPLAQQIFVAPQAFESLLTATWGNDHRRFKEAISQAWPQKRELELFSTPVSAGEGNFLGRLYVFRDVTKERQIDRMKSEFVSLVSHELRTPITSIMGYISLVQDGDAGPVNEEQKEYLDIALKNTSRLSSLVGDLLDVSRLESGSLQLKLGPVDLRTLVREALELLGPLIREKGQTVNQVLPEELPLVSGDSEQLTQVIINLLSNSYKYTTAGGRITVSVKASGNRIELAVMDTGVGLSPKEQGQLFTKFFRADHPATRKEGGTGLGLWITRSLVEMHNGHITVSSEPGKGSTFTVTLPIHKHLGRKPAGKSK